MSAANNHPGAGLATCACPLLIIDWIKVMNLIDDIEGSNKKL